MRKDMKLEIVQVSKKLFNKHGYNEVSTQDISDAMDISSSHYVKPNPPATLEELNALFLRVKKSPKKMRFISGIISTNRRLFP